MLKNCQLGGLSPARRQKLSGAGKLYTFFLMQEVTGSTIVQGKLNPYGVPGMMGDFPGGTVMMDPSMISTAIAGPSMDLNEDSLDAPPSVSSTEAGPIIGTPGTPGTPAPSGKDKKVSSITC